MSKLNKIVTNYPVYLNGDEVANLSSTLLPVIEACGGGGGGGITQYYGDGTYTEITGSHVITLTNETKQKINRTIPTKVSDLTDSANYQTVEEMAGYETTQHASQTYLTKSSADDYYAPLSTTADIEALKAVSGDFSLYYPKTQTSSDSELATEFAKYASKSDIETVSGNLNTLSSDVNTKYVTNRSLEETLNTYATKTYVTQQIANKQNKLTFGYDENNAISSIDGTSLAGNGGTTYSAGQYINIDSNDTISVTGLMALDEYAQYEPVLIGDSNITATSSKVNSHTQWNLRINATPVTTDTTLKGENVVTAHTTNVSGEWAVGLVQTAYEAIDSIAGISTDVGTLKTASAGWDKVSDKLDTTAFSDVSGNFLTAHQSLDDYATKSDINGMATQTWVGEQGFYTKASGDNDYAPLSITSTVNTLTGASASWNEVSARLGTAQYATDSATFVTSSTSVITGPKQYALTTAGWEVVQGGSTFTGVTTASPITGDGLNNTLGLDSNYKTAIEQVSGKVDKPADMTSNTPYCFSAGQWADMTQTYYSKTESTGTFLQKNLTNTLSGDGTSNNTLGVNWSNLSSNLINSANTASNAWISGTEFSSFAQIKTAIDSKQAAGDYVHISGDTITGGLTISAASGKNVLSVASEASLLGASRQTSANYGVNDTALGTTWMGVGGNGMHQGFIKYTDGGNVGALDSNNTIQINIKPENAGYNGEMTITNVNGETTSQSKVVNVPTASYNSMSSFDNTNGPNYMLRKTASGFDIGAAVINVTTLPAQTEANTYYFIYDT